MYCFHCGKPIPDGMRFCGYCGAPAAVPPGQPQPAAPAPQQAPHPAPGALPAGKSKKGLIIGLCAGGGALLLCAAVVLVLALFAFRSSGGESSGPFPVLELNGASASYGDRLDALQPQFPQLSEPEGMDARYPLTADGAAFAYFRGDPESAASEKVLAGWLTTLPGSGIRGGISVGDSYQEIQKAYPKALSSQEVQAQMTGEEAEPYDPSRVGRTSYVVYLDANGTQYSFSEYNTALGEARTSGEHVDLTQWLMVDFQVEGQEITRITFGDMQMLQMLR